MWFDPRYNSWPEKEEKTNPEVSVFHDVEEVMEDVYPEDWVGCVECGAYTRFGDRCDCPSKNHHQPNRCYICYEVRATVKNCHDSETMACLYCWSQYLLPIKSVDGSD
jgi:hypothetical protein